VMTTSYCKNELDAEEDSIIYVYDVVHTMNSAYHFDKYNN